MEKDKYLLEIAKTVSLNSKCKKRQIGAVIAKDGRIISTGYNGPPRKYPHCNPCRRMHKESGSPYDECPSVHAEMNAIINAARFGGGVDGCTMYISGGHPCTWCARMIANSGIIEIVYPYDSELTDSLKRADSFLFRVSIREV